MSPDATHPGTSGSPSAEAPARTASSLERLRDRVERAADEIERLREENARLAERVRELSEHEALRTEGGPAVPVPTLPLGGDPEAVRAQVRDFIEALDRVLAERAVSRSEAEGTPPTDA